METQGNITPGAEGEPSAADDESTKELASVDLNDLDGEKDGEELDLGIMQVRVQAAVMAGAALVPSVEKLIEDGTIELGVDLAEEVWDEIRTFASGTIRLSGVALSFLRDRASEIAAVLREERPGALDVLLESCRDLAELGCEAFAAVGAAFSIVAREMGAIVANVDWAGLYESGKDTAASFAIAANEAKDECGRIVGRILRKGWDLLDEAEQEEAAGSMEDVKRVSESLEDAVSDGTFGDAIDLVTAVLGAIAAKLSDDALMLLQRAIGALCRVGMEAGSTLWEALGPITSSLVEAGQPLTQLALDEIGSCQVVVKKYAEVGLDYAGLALGASAEFAQAAAQAARENARIVGTLLHDAVSSLIDEGAFEDVRGEILNALAHMRDTGGPIVGRALHETTAALRAVLDWLSDVDVKKLQSAVAMATQAGVAGMQRLWDEIQRLVPILIEEGREILEQIDLPSREEVRQAVEATLGAVGDVAELIGEHFDGMLNSEILQNGFGQLEDFYDMGRREMLEAFQKIAGATAGCCKEHVIPLVKLEIFRDVFQQLGLFFANLFDTIEEGITYVARLVWGFIGSLVAIDLGNLLPSQSTLIIAGIVILTIAAVILVVGYIWFLCVSFGGQSDELREGHEAENWREKKQRESKKVGRMGLILTGCLSIYLPLARTAIEILHCNGNYQYMISSVTDIGAFQCESGLMKGVAVFFLLLFVIPLPFCLIYFIQKSKPKGTPENPDITYDEDGHEVEFTDKLYNERVESDPDQLASPFLSLYKGYERKWSFYKVVVMIFKLVLVFPVIFLAPTYTKDEYKDLQECYDNFSTQEYQLENGSLVESKEGCNEYINEKYGTETSSASQSGATLGLVVAFSVFSFYSTPFIDPNSDFMDASGRVTSIVTTLVATIFAATDMEQTSVAANVLGIILMLCNLGNFLVIVGIIILGFPALRRWYKNQRKVLDFSDTCTGQTKLRAQVAVPNWNIDKEVKYRIWHAFWDSVLLNACGEEVAERFLQIKDRTRAFGLEKIKLHWQGFSDPSIRNLREKAQQELEGVDLYWNGVFGKMYIQPYPFHLVFVSDGSDVVTFIWGDDDLKEFINQQEDPQIVEAVSNRRKLRSLAKSGGSFALPFSQWETEEVQDGYDTVEVDDGNGGKQQKQVPHMTTVRFEVFYTDGMLAIGANTDKTMSAGFVPTIVYHDGHGEVFLPRTGETKYFTNRSVCLGQDHLGIDESFSTTSRLENVFAASEHLWEMALPGLLEEFQRYRNELSEQIKASENTSILGNGFWYFVYNNDKVNRTDLELYLREAEENPVLHSFPDDHKAGLDYLYLRTRYVQSHPVCALWYVFFADFWEENKDIELVVSSRDDFAPTSGNSICYRPLSRKNLCAFLEKKDLLGFFSDSVLDTLFERVNQLKEAAELKV